MTSRIPMSLGGNSEDHRLVGIAINVTFQIEPKPVWGVELETIHVSSGQKVKYRHFVIVSVSFHSQDFTSG